MLGVRSASQDSEEDIFRSAFASSTAAKEGTVKIGGNAATAVMASPVRPVGLGQGHGNHFLRSSSVETSAVSTTRCPHLQKAYSQQDASGHSDSSTEDLSRELEDGFIQISVSDPHKVGEGITSYVAYRVLTRTNLSCFRCGQMSVVRRFSDFLGLYEKLCDKHLSRGRVIPPPPEKSLVGTAKMKMKPGATSASAKLQSPSDGDRAWDADGFVSRRRLSLERFINRIGMHPALRKDPAFVEFVSGGSLPRATSTSALSSATVIRLLGRMGDTVNKITYYRMEETDPWYQEELPQIDALETQLRKFQGLVEYLVQCRQELASSTAAFAASVAQLAAVEEAHSLATALQMFARVQEKLEQAHRNQSAADQTYLLELGKDYVGLIGSVKDALNERAKSFQNWQHAQAMVIKKKEQRSRLEMAGRTDKMPSANEELAEWENRLEENQQRFNKISIVVKVELDLFHRQRVNDFKAVLMQYLEAVMSCQLQIVKLWEEFLPEMRNILY